MSLFRELKRRNVFRVGVAYAVGAWLLLQFTEVLSELLKLPDQVGPVVVALVALGFPVALFFAWAFELTPEGIKRESEIDRNTSITQRTGRTLDRAIIAMLLVVAAYFIWESRFANREGAPEQATTVAEATPAPPAAETQPTGPESETPAIDPQSIAVLPFDNRSRLEDDAFFVEGVHDDLLTNLARIGGVKVISRTSVTRYAGSDKSLPEIARELGVATIMEGAVQRSGDMVRINVQLIDAQTDEHLWAQIFDRTLTADNLFAIQTEISEQIAGALKTELSPDETARLVDRPTDDLEAYTAYLRGRQLMEGRRSDELEQALALFRQATELDPDFALAWVGMAEAADHATSYGTMEYAESIAIQERAVERALALDPDLGEAHLVNASLLHAQERQAGEEFRRAIELSPGNATAYHWYAIYLDDQPKGLPEAVRLLRRALEIDPLSSIIRSALVRVLVTRGTLDEAQRELDELMRLDPDFVPAFNSQAQLEQQRGRFDRQVVWLRRASELDPNNFGNYFGMVWTFLNLDDEEALARLRERMLRAVDEDHMNIAWLDMMRAMGRDNASGALEYIPLIREKMGGLPYVSLIEAYLSSQANEPERARAAFERYDPTYFDPERWHDGIVKSAQDACLAGWLMTNTGEPERGRALVDEAITYLESELPRFVEHPDDWGSEHCYAVRGDIESALDVVEMRLAHRHLTNWFFYPKFPYMAPLVRDPRFQELDRQRAEIMAEQREAIARMDLAEAGP